MPTTSRGRGKQVTVDDSKVRISYLIYQSNEFQATPFGLITATLVPSKFYGIVPVTSTLCGYEKIHLYVRRSELKEKWNGRMSGNARSLPPNTMLSGGLTG